MALPRSTRRRAFRPAGAGSAFDMDNATIINPSPGDTSTTPVALTIDADGGVLYRSEHTGSRIYLETRRPAGGAFQTPVQYDWPQAASLRFSRAPDGTAAISGWTGYNTAFAAVRPPGGTFAARQTIETAPPDGELGLYQPVLALNGNGTTDPGVGTAPGVTATPTPSPGVGTVPTLPTTRPTAPPKVTLTGPIGIRENIAPLPFSCPPEEPGVCLLTITLLGVRPHASAATGAKTKTIVLGKANAPVQPGKRKIINIKLSRTGRTFVKPRRTTAATLNVVVTVAGTKTTITKHVKLKRR